MLLFARHDNVSDRMDINPSVPRFNNNWGFTSEQWTGVILAGLISSILSLIANVCVITIHLILTWLRPYVVQRLSLRMIVVACVLNSIFCILQLVTDNIYSESMSCRAIAYILTASDTMACMCLAMVGLNLVSIFVFKFPRSVTLEVVYYVVVAISGVLVIVVPAFAGSQKGPHEGSPDNGSKTCWYHYYFEGRIDNIFNWMWYYGWLMFSLVFAAICAAISIRYITRKQKNFTGALNIFARRKKDIHTMKVLRKYGTSNTDIFRRIARRCVCYPLVPFFSKPWGVGIEIAAALHKNVPYPVYVLDRILSCLFGLMVGCIYFTDPAINAVFKELVDAIKANYVYEYFDVEYQPGSDEDTGKNAYQLKSVEITPLFSRDRDYIPPRIEKMTELTQREALCNGNADLEENILGIPHGAASGSRDMAVFPSIYDYQYQYPNMTTLQNQSQNLPESYSIARRRYSVVKVVTVNGTVFPSNEAVYRDTQNYTSYQNIFPKKDKTLIIPMRRLSSITSNATDREFDILSKNFSDTVKLVPFKYPTLAKLIHWVLTRIFKVKEAEIHDFENTDNLHRNEGVSIGHYQNELRDTGEKLQGNSPSTHAKGLNTTKDSCEKEMTRPPRGFRKSLSELETSSVKTSTTSPSIIPMRRASSINVATLQRERLKKELKLSNPSPAKSPSGQSLRSVAISTIKSQSVLRRVIGRRLSSNWIRLKKEKRDVNNKSHLASEFSFKLNDDEDAEESQDSNDSHPKIFSDPSSQEGQLPRDIKIRIDIDETDVGLSSYAVELAPRPLSQYTNHSSRNPNSKRGSIENSSYSSHKFIDNRNSIASINSISKDHSLNLNELFYGTTIIHTGMENLDNLVGQSSNRSSPVSSLNIEYPHSINMQDQCDGITFGTTILHNISNWQNGDNDENRITKITESWDIREQLKQQLTAFQR